MNEYLVKIAEEITNRPLPKLTSGTEHKQWQKEKVEQFQQMLGIDRYLNKERTSLNVQVTGELDYEEYTVKKIYFESLPNLFVCGNLYVPKHLTGPAPTILHLCGHSPKQKVKTQDHVRHYAKLGFVAFIIDTIQFGEVRGTHRGTHMFEMFDWVSKGYTPTSIEVWNSIRAIDLLEEMDEVDSNRIGMTGQSGGGTISVWTACCDERVKTIAVSCAIGTIASHIHDETLNTHCDCIFPANPYGLSHTEVSALVAPRPMLIVSPTRDKHFEQSSVQQVYHQLKDFYRNLDCEKNVKLFEFYGPHAYSSLSRRTIFQWFLKELQGKDIPFEDVEDYDGWQEAEENLLVYNGKPPVNDRSTNVEDWFIPKATQLIIDSKEDFFSKKQEVIQQLKKESFHFFNEDYQQSDDKPKIYQKILEKRNNDWIYNFSYRSEKDWSLRGHLQGNADIHHQPAKTVVYLRKAHDRHGFESLEMLDGLSKDWLKARLDVRGIGRTAWGEEMNWHIRRASALMGRSIASMRVLDTLNGLRAIRSMPEVDSDKLVLAGEGEMAAVTLYAALLDGNISTVILKNPPATHDSQSENDNIEIVNALRITDLPQIAGLLWPTKIIFVGKRPSAYLETEKLHRLLGHPGGTWRGKTMEDFQEFCYY